MEPDDRTARDVQNVLRAVVEAASRTGRTSAGALASAIERAATTLTRRATTQAIAEPGAVTDEALLRQALARRPAAPALASATTAALAARVARRIGPFRFLARRTPAWLVAAALPALYASVARGATELGLVASHLALRARAAGLEPDPELVHNVAVGLMSRNAPGAGTDAEARSGPLVVRWLRRAVRAALPFTAGVRTDDPDGIAQAAARVPVSAFARPPAPAITAPSTSPTAAPEQPEAVDSSRR